MRAGRWIEECGKTHAENNEVGIELEKTRGDTQRFFVFFPNPTTQANQIKPNQTDQRIRFKETSNNIIYPFPHLQFVLSPENVQNVL